MPLNKIINDFIESQGKSLTTNGYMKLEDGLIIQWGNTTAIALSANQSFSTTGTFSIAFPNTVLSTYSSTSNQEIICSAAAISNTQITLGFKNTLGVGASSNNRWFAIGY